MHGPVSYPANILEWVTTSEHFSLLTGSNHKGPVSYLEWVTTSEHFNLLTGSNHNGAIHLITQIGPRVSPTNIDLKGNYS